MNGSLPVLSVSVQQPRGPILEIFSPYSSSLSITPLTSFLRGLAILCLLNIDWYILMCVLSARRTTCPRYRLRTLVSIYGEPSAPNVIIYRMLACISAETISTKTSLLLSSFFFFMCYVVSGSLAVSHPESSMLHSITHSHEGEY